jgi:hypothetical protein
MALTFVAGGRGKLPLRFKRINPTILPIPIAQWQQGTGSLNLTQHNNIRSGRSDQGRIDWGASLGALVIVRLKVDVLWHGKISWLIGVVMIRMS